MLIAPGIVPCCSTSGGLLTSRTSTDQFQSGKHRFQAHHHRRVRGPLGVHHPLNLLINQQHVEALKHQSMSTPMKLTELDYVEAQVLKQQYWEISLNAKMRWSVWLLTMRGVGVVIPQFMTSMGVVCADIFKSLIPNRVNQSLNVSCLLIKIFREFTVAFG